MLIESVPCLWQPHSWTKARERDLEFKMMLFKYLKDMWLQEIGGLWKECRFSSSSEVFGAEPKKYRTESKNVAEWEKVVDFHKQTDELENDTLQPGMRWFYRSFPKFWYPQHSGSQVQGAHWRPKPPPQAQSYLWTRTAVKLEGILKISWECIPNIAMTYWFFSF